ncbi:hypothetical protein QMZ92_09275 [Streptomyces sp. HNM0645]|uniref:hypothetical protein n=1 Tax=Streptomyces sp. HNM0645 TaxID=2782343 RepID=UPI0024B77AD8|nr:hypothetical protein [Streptomyces sp. HNM0645]MDI9884585.1 hypothetical protein [Streptomyces sp. HNM0645]
MATATATALEERLGQFSEGVARFAGLTGCLRGVLQPARERGHRSVHGGRGRRGVGAERVRDLLEPLVPELGQDVLLK